MTLTSKQVERQRNVMSKHFLSQFDLDLWPTALTYNTSPAKVKIDPRAKYQGQRVQKLERPQTDRQTHTIKRIISPASRSINIVFRIRSTFSDKNVSKGDTLFRTDAIYHQCKMNNNYFYDIFVGQSCKKNVKSTRNRKRRNSPYSVLNDFYSKEQN